VSESFTVIVGEGSPALNECVVAEHERLGTGKLVGLILGCAVVVVMLFMMFAILGGLLSGGQ
jgi:hypothetical protein